VTADAVKKLISEHTEQPFLGFIGQPHVNVLMTNRALDDAIPKAQPKAR
jgi:K+-transporting ATPase ATPase C chain